MANKQWLIEQFRGLIQLNKDINDFILSSQNSMLPEIDQWIEESQQQIKRNNWLLDIIKKQLKRDYILDEEEIKLLNSI